MEAALLEVEIHRLEDAHRSFAASDCRRQQVTREVAEWVVTQWRQQRGRLGLQQHLPAVFHYVFTITTTSNQDGNTRHPVLLLGREIFEHADGEGCIEFFARLIASAFRTCFAVMVLDNASEDRTVNIVESFLFMTYPYSTWFESLTDAMIELCSSKTQKVRLYQAIVRSTQLSDQHKCRVLLAVCNYEPNNAAREVAAKELVPLAHVIEPMDVFNGCWDKSVKVRKAMMKCVMKMDAERMKESLGMEKFGRLIVRIAETCPASAEKYLNDLVLVFYNEGSTLQEICQLSIMLDDYGAKSAPLLRQVVRANIDRIVDVEDFATPTYGDHHIRMTVTDAERGHSSS